MATLKTRKIINSLTAKGFMPQNGDHKYLLFFVNGKKTRIKTKVSHGEDEIGDFLISQMQQQTHLKKKQDFLDLVNCPLSQRDYENILRSQGDIE